MNSSYHSFVQYSSPLRANCQNNLQNNNKCNFKKKYIKKRPPLRAPTPEKEEKIFSTDSNKEIPQRLTSYTHLGRNTSNQLISSNTYNPNNQSVNYDKKNSSCIIHNRHLENKFESLNTDNTELITNCEVLQLKISRLNEQNKEMENNIQSYKSKKLSFVNDNNDYKLKNEACKNKNQEEIKKISIFCNSLKNKQNDKLKQEKENKELNMRYIKIMNDYKEILSIKEKTFELIKEKANFETELSQIKKELDNKEMKLTLKEKSIKKLQEINESLKEDNNKINKEKNKILNEKEENDDIIEKYKELKGKIQQQISIIQNLKDQINDKDEKINILSLQYENLNNKLSKENSIKTIRKKDYKREIENERNKNRELECLIDVKRKENQSLIKINEEIKIKNLKEIQGFTKQYDNFCVLNEIQLREHNELLNENLKLKKFNSLLISLIQNDKQISLLNTKNQSLSINNQSISEPSSNSSRTSVSCVIYKKPIHSKIKNIKSNINFNIFTFSNNKIFSYEVEQKKFEERTDIIGYPQFISNYYPKNGFIYTNLQKGLFILVGKDNNIIYLYSHKTNQISKICTLFENHLNGSMILNQKDNSLIILSGALTNKVEKMDIQTNKTFSLPSLCYPRAFGAFCFVNTKLYAFFGFDCERGEYIENIEAIDTEVNDKWNMIEIKDKENWSLKFIKHICINYSGNKILLFGGEKGEEREQNYKFYKIDLEKLEIYNTNMEIPHKDKEEFLFEKSNCYNFINIKGKENAEQNLSYMVTVDDNNNIHYLNSEMVYDITYSNFI